MITRLRYDTTELFTLTGGGSGDDAACIGVIYFPRTPTLDMSIIDEIERWESSSVTEACEVWLSGTSADVIAAVQMIELILEKAKRRLYTVISESAYIEYQAHSGASVYRSRILDGRVEWAEASTLRRLPDSGSATVKITVIWTRAGFWEGPEVEIALATTASSGAAVTGGRTIYNYDGATTGHDNYVAIASNQVTGIAPAPIRTRLQNLNGASRAYKHLHMCVNALAIPGMAHNVEGESFVTPSSAIVATVADASGGQAAEVSFTGTATVKWALAYGFLQQSQGRPFRILARMPTFGSAVYAQSEIRTAGGILLASSDAEVLLANATYLQDFGVLPLPPGGYNPYSDDLHLYLQLRSTASATVQLDYFQFFATEAYRLITQRGDTLVANEAIHDNMIDQPRQIYSENPSTSRRRALFAAHGRLYVWPGRDQRIYTLWDGTSVTTTDTFKIQAWYRPRVITV